MMNERIRELGDFMYGYAAGGTSHNDGLRFALLIAKECISHIESSIIADNIEQSRVKTNCINAIKEYFGVE